MVKISRDTVAPLALDRPVMGVSSYEADAYARYVGKQLPTEAEWEKAALSGVLAMTGWVWNGPLRGSIRILDLLPIPIGYSVPYFDNQHRVLRGGSWATQSHVRRPTFRTWYHPWVREIFSGMRCIQNVSMYSKGMLNSDREQRHCEYIYGVYKQ